MSISKNSAVSIDYVLANKKGEILDSSTSSEPMVYLHGSGQILPALERLIEGKKIGDKIDVTLSPEDGYGVRNEDLLRGVPKSEFSDIPDIAVGMQFQVDAEEGPVVLNVVEVKDDEVILDGNHPLAGIELHFKVEIKAVRPATKEELSHGHVHGPGGHHH